MHHLVFFPFLFSLDKKLRSAKLIEAHADAKYERKDHNPNSEKCRVFPTSCIFKHMMKEFQHQEFYEVMHQAQFFYCFHQTHELQFLKSLEEVLIFLKEYALSIQFNLLQFCALNKI
jgi:hypothetical protein